MRKTILSIVLAVALIACDKKEDVKIQTSTITVENVLDAKPLVESGSFQGSGTSPVILPGQSVTITFYAKQNQYFTFATMYGWSNDLFFAPENPGIKLFNDDGTPVTGDVSSQLKIWDNGTRMNAVPGSMLVHPGTAEATPKNIKAVSGGMDDYGHSFPAAGELMKATLAYSSADSKFTLTLQNISGGKANETPFSPGVWAVSYVLGTAQLLPNALFTAGKPGANGLTNIAERGDVTDLKTYLTGQTGIFTPFSPILVVVYRGSENPFFKVGENDRGEGLKNIAQMGNADDLANALKAKSGVKAVYILKEPTNTVLLPKMNGVQGGKVMQQLTTSDGDRIAIATMYGFSNDWFFATSGNGIDATQKGDFSSIIKLYDSGTAVDQFPGANNSKVAESKTIQEVPNPNPYNTLPEISKIIKVTIQ